MMKNGHHQPVATSTSALSVSEIQRQRRDLPIFAVREKLIEQLKSHPRAVIVGETGSGKTTQIPQYLVESGLRGKGRIAVTQPRRVAAITVAQRVAQEMGVELGKEVGYSVRFADCTSDKTVIKYLTDGMLLRESLVDPLLSRYSVIILDEAHERTLNTDILFGIVKGIQKTKRPDLKIIAMSASLDIDLFRSYFECDVLYIAGRQFPVETYYASEPQEDYQEATLVALLQLHLTLPEGHILAFLTGREEIEWTEKSLLEKAKKFPPTALKMEVCPIFAALSWEEQRRAFEAVPAGTRKVILATNIAETSITINNVKYVVDPGMVKMRGFNAKIGLEALIVVPISKAQAAQRSGRAGRDGPGVCFRLYTENHFSTLRDATLPEIRRSNLASVILQLKRLGVEDVRTFDYIEKPAAEALKRGVELLLHLGALAPPRMDITELGKRMAELPLEPMFSKTVILSEKFNCTDEILTIVSMLSVESVFVSPREKRQQAAHAKAMFASPHGDHLMLLNVYKAYMGAKGSAEWCWEHFINLRAMRKVVDIRTQLAQYCDSMGIKVTAVGDADKEAESVRKCFVAGFFLHVAILRTDNKYHTLAESKEVHIHPSSTLFNAKKPGCVLYNELVRTTKQYMREVLVVEPQWLSELAPQLYQRKLDADAKAPSQ